MKAIKWVLGGLALVGSLAFCLWQFGCFENEGDGLSFVDKKPRRPAEPNFKVQLFAQLKELSGAEDKAIDESLKARFGNWEPMTKQLLEKLVSGKFDPQEFLQTGGVGVVAKDFDLKKGSSTASQSLACRQYLASWRSLLSDLRKASRENLSKIDSAKLEKCPLLSFVKSLDSGRYEKILDRKSSDRTIPWMDQLDVDTADALRNMFNDENAVLAFTKLFGEAFTKDSFFEKLDAIHRPLAKNTFTTEVGIEVNDLPKATIPDPLKLIDAIDKFANELSSNKEVIKNYKGFSRKNNSSKLGLDQDFEEKSQGTPTAVLIKPPVTPILKHGCAGTLRL